MSQKATCYQCRQEFAPKPHRQENHLWCFKCVVEWLLSETSPEGATAEALILCDENTKAYRALVAELIKAAESGKSLDLICADYKGISELWCGGCDNYVAVCTCDFEALSA